MKLKFKHAGASLVVLFLCLTTATPVYAGSLNANEQRVISAAQGQFEYNGVNYQLSPTYKSKLQSYLFGDDVDLTAEDADTVLASMYDYVESGVEEGYLVPIVEQTQPSNSNSSESDGLDPENNNTVKSNDNSENDTTESSDTDTGNSKNGNTNNGSLSNDNTNSDSVDSEGSFIGGLLSGDTKDSLTSDEVNSNQSADETNNNSEDNLSRREQPIIKETGFNLNRTVQVAAGMGLIMLIGMIVTIKYNFFAQSDD